MTDPQEGEILLTGAQIGALPRAMAGLPSVERLRVGQSAIPGNGTVSMRGYRDVNTRRMITSDGTIFAFNDEGKPMGMVP